MHLSWFTRGCLISLLVVIMSSCGGKNKGPRVDPGPGVDPSQLPPTPTNVAAFSGRNEITISWAPVDNVSGYYIYWLETDTVNTTNGTQETSTDPKFIHQPLPLGVSYFYIVTAFNDFGESLPSAPVFGESTANVFDPTPREVVAVGGDAQISLSWKGAEGALSYNIYWSSTASVDRVTNPPFNSLTADYVDTTPPNGGRRFYIVTTNTISGESRSSNEASALASANNFRVQIQPGAYASSLQTHMSWLPGFAIENFAIYWSTPSCLPLASMKREEFFDPYGDIDPYVNFNHKGLTPGINHCYKITQLNGNTESPESVEINLIPLRPIQAPNISGILVLKPSATDVEVIWPDAVESECYDVAASTSPGVTPNNNCLINPSNITSPYLFTGLSPNTQYFFNVTARNEFEDAGGGTTLGEDSLTGIINTYPAFWTHQVSSKFNNDDISEDIIVDSNDNIILVGHTHGNFSGVDKQGVDSDMIIVKYNANNRILWTRQVGSIANDQATAVTLDSSNNIYVAGWTEGDIIKDFSKRLNRDMVVAKFDTNGDQLMLKQFGSPLLDEATGIAVDSGGNIYVSGKTRGAIEGFPNAAKSGNDEDAFLLKLNANGDPVWIQLIGTDGIETANDLVISNDGSLNIIGTTTGDLTGSATTLKEDIFLAKYSALGVQTWLRQIGTDQSDFGNALDVDNSGNIYIAAQYNKDILTAKYTASGNQSWQRIVSSDEIDTPLSIAVTGNTGTSYVTGVTEGDLEGATGKTILDDDSFIVSYDTVGNRIDLLQYGASYINGNGQTVYTKDTGSAVTVGNNTDVYFSGLTQGSLNSIALPEFPANRNASYDIYLERRRSDLTQ